MEVYLIRHGQTAGNVAYRHQADSTPLTDVGLEQARQVAQKVKDLEPTHLLSSPLLRALETAREIGAVCNLVPETNHNFIELKRPDQMYGNFLVSTASVWYYTRWFYGYSNGGDSYQDIRLRIKEAKEHFRNYPENARVAVVSHSVFINFFLAHLCDDNAMSTFTAMKTFLGIVKMDNTEFVPLIFDPAAYPNTCGWWRVED